MPTDKDYQEYVQSVLKALGSAPDKLEKSEIQLGNKYRAAQERFGQICRDMDQIRNQMRQSEAQLRSLELQAADVQGRMAGLVECLIAYKFPEVDSTPPPKEPVKPPTSTKPTKAGRKS